MLRFHHHSSLELKYKKISFTARGTLKVNWQILKDSVRHFLSHIHTYIYDPKSRQFDGEIFLGDYCCCSCWFLTDMQRLKNHLTINTEPIFALPRMFAKQLSRSIFFPRRSVRTMYGRIVIETGHVFCIKTAVYAFRKTVQVTSFGAFNTSPEHYVRRYIIIK